MGNENVGPIRNPTRFNKTIKRSGYHYDENEKAEKECESENDRGRGGEVHHGEFNRKESDLNDRGRIHPKTSGRSHAKK